MTDRGFTNQSTSAGSQQASTNQLKYGSFFHKYTNKGSGQNTSPNFDTKNEQSQKPISYSNSTYSTTSDSYKTSPTPNYQYTKYNDTNIGTSKDTQPNPTYYGKIETQSTPSAYKIYNPSTSHEVPQKNFQKYTDYTSPTLYSNLETKPVQNQTFKKKQFALNSETGRNQFSKANKNPVHVQDLKENTKGLLKRADSFDQQQVSPQNYTHVNVPKLDKKIKYSDFQIGDKLGKGMFGQVMRVKHKQTGWMCGLKVMKKKVIKEEKYAGQIARQLSIQFFLSHPNILTLYGYFQDEENVYLLMQLGTQDSLYQKLKQQRKMKEREVSLIIRQICEGVQYIHNQLIIHRDIKPQNIIFTQGSVKICDFGWAVYRGYGMRSTTSGSPLYYPPQIVKGQKYDEKIDNWCIGMMAYECIIGKTPFKVYTQNDLGKIVSDQVTFPEWVQVSNQAKDFILKVLRKNPEQRLQIYQMLEHPFIKKYRQSQVPQSIIQQFRKVIN